MINSEKEVLKEKVVELETDLEVREEEFSSRAQLQVAAVQEELNSAKMEEIEELLQKLKAAESTITESVTTKDMLQGKLVELQGELAGLTATVEQLNQCKAELKELVLVMQEKEQVERELRPQVLELKEQVKEQGSGKESLVASLEAAQQQVEMAMVTRAAMELDLKDSKEVAEEATKTALVRLEKCKTVELEVEEMTKEKEQLGVKLASLAAALAAREEEGEKEAGLLQDTADRLHASSQEVQGLKDQLNELEVKQNNDLNAEKEMIKQQFETMAKNFETQKEELEGRLEEKQNEYSETVKIMEENRNTSEKSTSEKDEMLKNINDKFKTSEKSISDLEESSKHLVSELSKAKEEIKKGLADCQEAKKNLKSSEKSRSMVEQELKDAKANMVTTEKHASVKALMTTEKHASVK